MVHLLDIKPKCIVYMASLEAGFVRKTAVVGGGHGV